MKKSMPIGISDFKKIIKENYYYFDKTNLIEKILTDNSEVKLFTRPRRFGKTLNMSMLKYFFDIKEKDENRELFKNLKIAKSKFFEKQGSASVISISFRNYSEKNWENGFKTIKTAIADIYAEFKFLMDKLDKRELKKFENIWLETDEGDWKNSLLMLTKYLYEYYGQKVIVLIDEYDHPIIDSYVKGYYDDAIDFFKSFYGTVLKDNNYLEMGIMTGILRVAKENIFSGLNNLEVHTILDNEFTEYFGITEEEVNQAVKDFGLEYELEDVQKWYNGYLFGDRKVYNPWSIVNFLKRKKLKPYWVNTSGNELIKLYLRKLKNEIDENRNDVSLKIPNEEILRMFSEMFIDLYFENYDIFLEVTEALKKGDAEKFKKELNKILLENVGIFDVGGIYKEQFYHGFMLGLVIMLKNEYEISSNNFAGKGRYDLLLKPKNIEKRKEGIILELKIVNSSQKLNENEIQKELEKECDIALKQIEEKKYSSVLKNAGIDNILKIGLAFFGKEVEVKFEKEK